MPEQANCLIPDLSAFIKCATVGSKAANVGERGRPVESALPPRLTITVRKESTRACQHAERAALRRRCAQESRLVDGQQGELKFAR